MARAGLRPPVILDEWQEVPELLGAVKRSVDEDPSPGRYILTGSVRAELENQVWPGTGRLLQIPMFGMSVREVRGRASAAPFIDRVIDGGPDAVTAPEDALSVRDYLDLMLAGSFPYWQLALSLALMVISIWAVIWFASRLYRIGILMYGKRATLPELLRWLRYS